MFVQNGGGMIMQNTPARWGHVYAKSQTGTQRGALCTSLTTMRSSSWQYSIRRVPRRPKEVSTRAERDWRHTVWR